MRDYFYEVIKEHPLIEGKKDRLQLVLPDVEMAERISQRILKIVEKAQRGEGFNNTLVFSGHITQVPLRKTKLERDTRLAINVLKGMKLKDAVLEYKIRVGTVRTILDAYCKRVNYSLYMKTLKAAKDDGAYVYTTTPKLNVLRRHFADVVG